MQLRIRYITQYPYVTWGNSKLNVTEFADYQWLDCDNNFTPIPGATNATYTPSANGDYALELTVNGCVDTSDCVQITSIGLSENPPGDDLLVFPNPTTDIVNIMLKNERPLTIKLSDLNGKTLLSTSKEASFVLDLSRYSSGLYLLHLESEHYSRTFKIEKQ